MSQPITTNLLLLTDKTRIWKLSEFKEGMRFLIKMSPYTKNIFTVQKIAHGMLYCDDSTGTFSDITFIPCNLEFYSPKIQILSKFDAVCSCGNCEREDLSFVCDGCDRVIPYCLGGDDKRLSFCTDCSTKQFVRSGQNLARKAA